jgi:hypothetical protein
LQVETITTSDRSLLHAVRSTLDAADDAFLCVAFVQEKGLHLLEKELDGLRRRRVRSRLLVTTTFQTTSQAALAMASRLGLEVRILNPGSGRTFHPKLYLGTNGSGAQAVIGSANLTGSLATNFEAAVALMADPRLRAIVVFKNHGEGAGTSQHAMSRRSSSCGTIMCSRMQDAFGVEKTYATFIGLPLGMVEARSSLRRCTVLPSSSFTRPPASPAGTAAGPPTPARRSRSRRPRTPTASSRRREATRSSRRAPAGGSAASCTTSGGPVLATPGSRS